MVDPHLQERFTRHCTDAAFGYTAAAAATTSAVAPPGQRVLGGPQPPAPGGAFADQVLSFWADALQPSRSGAAAPTALTPWSWPVPARQEVPPLAFNPFAWAAPQSYAPQSYAPMPYAFGGAGANPFAAWLGMFPFAAPPAAWPMAFMFMASGMPRSVAWPAAEANLAVMEAADVAAVSVRKVFSSYRTDGGHSTAQQGWPAAHLMMLAVLVPLNIGAMLTSLRVA